MFIQNCRQNHLDVPGKNTAFWSMGDMTNHDVDVLGCNSKHHIQYVYIYYTQVTYVYIYIIIIYKIHYPTMRFGFGRYSFLFVFFFKVFFCFSV